MKVNPFNQMIGKDSALASLFYNGSSTHSSLQSSVVGTKFGMKSNLTLENIKRHELYTQEANTKFLPRINRLVDIANRRFQNRDSSGPHNKSSTRFSATYSIFDALYEMESFNNLSSTIRDTEDDS